MNERDTTSTSSGLWFGLLAGPLAWSAHEIVSYAFVKVACESNVSLILDVVTLLAFALCAAGAYVAVRARRRRRETPELLASIGLLGNVLFAFAILLEGLPNVVVSPCL